MVGIPKVNRCEHCRRRRIKPTCGTCQRAKRVCSGPPTGNKFVHNGDHAATTASYDAAEASSSTCGEDEAVSAGGLWSFRPSVLERRLETKTVLVETQQRPAASGGGTFSKLRTVEPGKKPRPPVDPKNPVFSEIPPKIRRTCIDCVAAETVYNMESSAGSVTDIAQSFTWISLATPRVYESNAFCTAVSLWNMAWGNVRRAIAAPSVLPLECYGKALRFLRAALVDPKLKFHSGTLASITLIHKIEIDLDGDRAFSAPSNHASGLYALMIARGPPRLHDELDVHLCFEILNQLVVHLITHPVENFYTHPEWMDARRRSRPGLFDNSPYKDQYRLSLHLAHWPDLVRRLRKLRVDDPDPVEASDIAAAASRVLEELRIFDSGKIIPLWERGHIRSTPDATVPWGEAYEFVDWPTSQLFQMHAMISIVMARIKSAALLHTAATDEPRPDAADAPADLEQQLREWSQRIWKLQSFVGRFPLVSKSACLAPLLLSFESTHAGEPEREVVQDKIAAWASYRRSRGSQMTEAEILRSCRTATGRLSAAASAAEMMAYDL